MAVRIPGQQPTFGLERWFLPGDPGWMPAGTSSAGGVLAPSTGFVDELADRQVAPAGANLAGDQGIPTDSGMLQAVIDDRANVAAVLADRVNSKRGDPLAAAIPGVQDAVNRTGQGIGPAPTTGPIVPPPPADYNPDNPKGPQDING